MADLAIPTYQDLMYPTLEALTQPGGSASNSELEDPVPDLAGVTEEQLAIEFVEPSKMAGTSKVLSRLHWSRTYLRKIGAIESSTRGISSITPVGTEYAGMGIDAGTAALKAADSEARRLMRQTKALAGSAGDDSDD